VCARVALSLSVLWRGGRSQLLWLPCVSNKKVKAKIRQDPLRSHRPDLPDASMSHRVSGSTFTQHLMQSNIKNNLRSA
jgi:hypothetical protein